jgi:hypothetical protein
MQASRNAQWCSCGPKQGSCGPKKGLGEEGGGRREEGGRAGWHGAMECTFDRQEVQFVANKAVEFVCALEPQLIYYPSRGWAVGAWGDRAVIHKDKGSLAIGSG